MVAVACTLLTMSIDTMLIKIMTDKHMTRGLASLRLRFAVYGALAVEFVFNFSLFLIF